jgi:hypothetical protein
MFDREHLYWLPVNTPFVLSGWCIVTVDCSRLVLCLSCLGLACRTTSPSQGRSDAEGPLKKS